MTRYSLPLLSALALLAAPLCTVAEEKTSPAKTMFDPQNVFFAIPLKGFFPGKTKKGELKNLNIYATRRDGEWTAVLGTATNSGKPVWNRALMPIDASELELTDSTISGQLKVTLVPDPWVPKDQKAREAIVEIDGKIGPSRNSQEIAHASGTFKATIDEAQETLEAANLAPETNGEFSGGLANVGEQPIENVSYDLTVFNLGRGHAYEIHHSRRAVSLGIKDGKPISLRTGNIGLRGHPDGYKFQPLKVGEHTVTGDTFHIPVEFRMLSLDGDLLDYTVTFDGVRLINWLVGSWKGVATDQEGKEQPVSGFFRGAVNKGAHEAEAVDPRPWFSKVKGFTPPEPGEHPRLFFRKEDVPELRRRAETPEGKKIVDHLRKQLNGSDGKTLPTSYNPAQVAYPRKGKKVPKSEQFKPEMGTFTIMHPAGYGFLYQLTGEQLYADLARQSIEKLWEGQRDRDPRYSWVRPGGELRTGPSVGWVAVAYDLCYDGWDKDFRQKVAKAIQDYDSGGGGEWDKEQEGGITLRKMVLQPRHGPGSNHFGAVIGGSGLAVLAILNDPGVDTKELEKYRNVLELQLVRSLSAGWGDGGYFKEGWGASRVGTQSSLLSFMQALRNVVGHDYLNVERPNASAITMIPRSMMLLGPPAYFPYRSNMNPSYGGPDLGKESKNETITKGGYFSEGFGAIKEEQKPALLWTYEKTFNPTNEGVLDLKVYPHRSMLALVNWPTFEGIEAKSSAEFMPLTSRDSLYEYFVFRNRFQDKNDIVTTVLIEQPRGTKPRSTMVWGLGGLRLNLTEPQKGAKVTDYTTYEDGSGVLKAGEYALAVDYSGNSGADDLIVTASPTKPTKNKTTKPKVANDNKNASYQQFTLDNKTLEVLVLSSSGTLPAVVVEDSKIKVGDQKIAFEGGKFSLPR